MAVVYIEGSRPTFWGKERNGFVYLLRRTDGLYKIGCAWNIGVRQATLETKYGPLELIHSFAASDHFTAERLLHRYFKANRIEDEWFSLTPGQVYWIAQIEDFLGHPPFFEAECAFALTDTDTGGWIDVLDGAGESLL